MIVRGAPQTLEYESSSAPLYHITKDNQGRERKPDQRPSIEIFNPSGTQLVAPASVAATIDFGALGLTNLDTVLIAGSPQAGDPGVWAHDWTVQVIEGGALSLTIDHNAKTILAVYDDGVSTVTQFEALFSRATLRGDDAEIVRVGTAGTGANILAAPGDNLAATAFSGGVGAAMERQLSKARYVSYFGKGLTEGFLAYTNQTAEFRDGAKVTGGTSGATGIIRGQVRDGDYGVLHLGNVDGLFEHAEAISGSSGGVATQVWGELYTCEHYYFVDASAAATWPYGENYYALITWLILGQTYTKKLFFDVGFLPLTRPFVTSQDIENIHPTWRSLRPKDWGDWGEAVRGGHGDLIRRIHAHGEKSSEYVKSESEFWRIELAFIEMWMAVNLEFEEEDRKRWQAHAESTWGQRGLLTKKENDDDVADQTTIQARLLK